MRRYQHSAFKPQWKTFEVEVKNYQTHESEKVIVVALNEGQAKILGLRKSSLIPAGVESVEELAS